MEETKKKPNSVIWIVLLVALFIGVMLNRETKRNNEAVREAEIIEMMEQDSILREHRQIADEFDKRQKRLDSLDKIINKNSNKNRK